MATVSWVVFKHHKKKDGTYNPKLQIIHKGSSAYIATGINTDLVRFKRGSSSGIVTSDAILRSLDSKVGYVRDMINENEDIVSVMETAKQVKEFVVRRSMASAPIDFLDFASRWLEGVSVDGTKRAYGIWIRSFAQYVERREGAVALPVERLSSNYIKDYERWLGNPHDVRVNGKMVTRAALSKTSIRGYVLALSLIFNKLKESYNDYDSGRLVIRNDPFVLYSAPKAQAPVKKALSRDELYRIMTYEPLGNRRKNAILARDLFAMSFALAGMNLADMVDCPPFVDRVEYERKKTRNRSKGRSFVSVGINPFISDVVDRYRDPDMGRGFDLYKRYKDPAYLWESVSNGLKLIGKDLGIPPFTFYAARHSFATIARNDCGASMDDVAFCLAHASSHAMTSVYVAPDYKRIDNVVSDVIGFVFGEGTVL